MNERSRLTAASILAERGGFEPPVGLAAHLISNQAPSTTRTPLQKTQLRNYFSPRARSASKKRSRSTTRRSTAPPTPAWQRSTPRYLAGRSALATKRRPRNCSRNRWRSIPTELTRISFTGSIWSTVSVLPKRARISKPHSRRHPVRAANWPTAVGARRFRPCLKNSSKNSKRKRSKCESCWLKTTRFSVTASSPA